MKKNRMLLVCLLIASIDISLIAQSEKVHFEGAMVIENSDNPSPAPGTLRWTGLDFEGYDGYEWVSLTGRPIHGTVTDYDGNEYKTIKLGGNIWMAENLRVTHLNDGDDIPQITTNDDWSNMMSSARSVYGQYPTYIQDFGYLYNGYAAATDKLCPTGWHIPTTLEYTQIFETLGFPILDNTQYLGAGAWLKSENLNYFNSTDIGSIDNRVMRDSYGFDARGGGSRTSQGFLSGLKDVGRYWASDSRWIEFFAKFNYVRIIPAVYTTGAYSVRCVQDL